MTGTTGKIDRSTLLALVAMALGVFVIANDFTALSVAIPEIDLFGRKRIFMIGAAFFAAFSLAAGLMPTVVPLILCRGLMGIGGALMWPAILGMTYSLLPSEKAGLAGGLIIGVAGVGNAVGPLLGGFLTDALSWRWVFFINVPVTAFAVFVTYRLVSESAVDTTQRHIDYAGVAVLSVGIVSILLALDEGSEEGFGDPPILALFALGAVMLGSFLVVERRQGAGALVPHDVLRNRVFTGSAGAVLLMSAIFFAAILYLPQFFEKELDYSPLGSGAGLLPLMLVFAITSFAAGPLYGRLGARLVVSGGAACLAIGIFWLSLLDADSSYTSLVPGMVVLGIGVGLFYSSVTTVAVTALDPSQSSLAGGIVYMCQIAGGAVGLGFNTAIIASASSLTDGISLAFKVDAVLGVLGFLLVLAVIGRHEEVTPPAALRTHHRAHA
jgi:EmrB/QacA subfamily drug resistance transporter